MSDNLEKFAGFHKPEPTPEAYLALARVVRTLEGSKRFKVPLGTPIQNHPKELKKLGKTTEIDPETGRVKNPIAPKINTKLFAQRVEELKKSIEKLDTNAIKNLLKQLESAKDLPKSANYQKIREMLEKYLKERSGKDDKLANKAKGKSEK